VPRTVRLTLVREAAGLSRDALAVYAGISPRTVYNIEVRGKQPHRATKRVLALTLGVAVEEIFPTENGGLANETPAEAGRWNRPPRDSAV